MSDDVRPIRLVFLASVRERAGRGSEAVSPPETVATVGALLDWLRSRGDVVAAALSVPPAALRCAVNQRFVRADAAVRPGDEVAIFPPVTGG